MDNKSISLVNPHPSGMNVSSKIAVSLISIALLILFLSFFNIGTEYNYMTLYICLGFITLGTILFTKGSYSGTPEGIKNHYVWFRSLSSRGVWAWALGIILTTFYVLLYWFPQYLGQSAEGNTGIVSLFDPLCMLLKGKAASQWFVYGTLYTVLIFALGIKFIYKYRHNRYQLIRTIVVIFSQLVLAYFIPEVLEGFNSDAAYFTKDIKAIWPLNYYITEDWYLNAMQQPQAFGPSGVFYFMWALILFLIITPVLTYYVGKRWYCSWVCGCGGLAETAGDSFRQLSSKKMDAWKLERWLIHSIMVFVLIMSVGVFYTYFSGNEFNLGFITINSKVFSISTYIFLVVSLLGLVYAYYKLSNKNKYLIIAAVILFVVILFLVYANISGNTQLFVMDSKILKQWYGFGIGSLFSGVIGVGFYPLLGNRVWCRFGCPMAGYMGLIQRFKSRFRITTNGGQCISCGNCSTYCEQGIDVRAYAQKGENIVRASCVGCGICSAVCPRGVLKLENGPEKGRITEDPREIIQKMVSKKDS